MARGFLALATGDALARVIAFGAAVYVARALGPDMFGVIGFASAVVLYFTHLAGCGIDMPAMREVASDPARVQALGPGALTARLLLSVLMALLLAGAALAFLPAPESGVLALYALTLLAVGPSPRWILLGLSRPRPVAVARTAGEALFLGLVLALVRREQDIGWVPWAQFLGDTLATALMLVWLRRTGLRLPLRADWERVRPLFARSFPLVLNILLGLVIYNADLICLRLFRDSRTVGWYSASYQLISFLINIAWAYSFSLLPSLTRASGVPADRDRLYGSALAHAFAVALPISVGGALAAPALIAFVFEAQYAPSALPLSILLCSVPFMVFKDTGTVALIVAGREGLVLRLTGAGMLFNLLANLLVIPRYGMAGAACTTLATEMLRALLSVLCVRRLGWPGVPFARLLKSSAAAAAMAGVLLLVGPLPLWQTLALGVASYALVLALLGGLTIAHRVPVLRL